MDEIKLDDIIFTPDNQDDYKQQILSYIEMYPKDKKGRFQWARMTSIFNDNGLKTLQGKVWNRNNIRIFNDDNKNKTHKQTNNSNIKRKKTMDDTKKEDVKEKPTKKPSNKKKDTIKEDTSKKVMKKISKKEMKKIILYLKDNPMKSKDIKSRFHLSLVTSGVIKNVISNTQWKKVCEETPLPDGYFYPSNVKQTIYSVMYDLGLFV